MQRKLFFKNLIVSILALALCLPFFIQPAYASHIPPKAGEYFGLKILKKYGEEISEEEIFASVYTYDGGGLSQVDPSLTGGAYSLFKSDGYGNFTEKIFSQEEKSQVFSGHKPGRYMAELRVLNNKVQVPILVKGPYSSTYGISADPIYKDYGKAPSSQELIGAVKLPSYSPLEDGDLKVYASIGDRVIALDYVDTDLNGNFVFTYPPDLLEAGGMVKVFASYKVEGSLMTQSLAYELSETTRDLEDRVRISPSPKGSKLVNVSLNQPLDLAKGERLVLNVDGVEYFSNLLPNQVSHDGLTHIFNLDFPLEESDILAAYIYDSNKNRLSKVDQYMVRGVGVSDLAIILDQDQADISDGLIRISLKKLASLTAFDLSVLVGQIPDGRTPGTYQVPVEITYSIDGNTEIIYVPVTIGPRSTDPGKVVIRPIPREGQVGEKVARIYGENRIETAVELSKKYYSRAETVIVADQGNFADALTASVLAYIIDAPILLTHTNILSSEVEREIIRLGAEEIVIVGGRSSVSDRVKEDLDYYDADTVESFGGQTGTRHQLQLLGR